MKIDEKEIPYIWSNGKVIQGANYISTLSSSFHYAGAVWEGIRVYKGAPFKVKEHYQRFLKSAKIMGIEIPYSVNDLILGTNALIVNYKTHAGCSLDQQDWYIRPIAYYKVARENQYPYDMEVAVDIYMFPIGGLYQENSREDGVKCIISSYKRGYPYQLMEAKTPANYALVNLALKEARAAGADEALFTDRNDFITEATVANLFVISDGALLTPPCDGSILNGITRQIVLSIAHDNLIPVHVLPITRSMLSTADDAFLTGTYAEIVRIKSVDHIELPKKNVAIFNKIVEKFDVGVSFYTSNYNRYGEGHEHFLCDILE